jgi:hypothetical protein
MAEREESPPRPDRAALMPITRLMAANLERLKAAGATSAAGRPVRLAARLYVAGGCDVLAEGLGMDGAAVMEECLVLLGETREDAAAFAGCLEGFLVSPLHAALYRAGREDLAARPEGDGPGEAFVAALAPWITAWENPPAANLVVAAVAPLAPRHRPAVEAVIRAFGGEPCGRPGPHLLASFGDPLGALDVAQTLREAVQAAAEERAPGIGLAVATLPRPDQDDPGLAVAACLDVAEAAGPGGVAVSQTLRAILAGKGRRRAFAPLPDGDAEGWLLTGEGAEGEPATVA